MNLGVVHKPDPAGQLVLPATSPGICDKLLAVFHQAAGRVPAYRAILAEAGVNPARIASLADFLAKVPLIDKRGTFGRFGIAELCLDGQLSQPLSVLTSSGHSGLFSYGVYDGPQAQEACRRTDAALEAAFGVCSRRTLLINCLPMGVKVPTRTCTVAETSVRPDMVTALVRQFAAHYEQLLLVGEAAFIKRVLELGRSQGIRWDDLLVHILVGEETLAENARTYLASFLDTDLLDPRRGLVASSMGMAEFGLNLFSELPVWSSHPPGELIRIRRALHLDPALREAVLGPGCRSAPMVMTYDPEDLFVEVLPDGTIVLTSLELDRPIPLIRYHTGDKASILRLPAGPARRLRQAAGLQTDVLEEIPIILFAGRGEGVRCGDVLVTPEQIKEGLYADPGLAAMTTCNFRLTPSADGAHVKIQLSPGLPADWRLPARFAQGIEPYAGGRVEVTCQEYFDFREGLELDYERKFAYLANDN